MKVAFVGKGGSGKTTLSALFARYLAAAGVPVVAIDADINQHLAVALGLPGPEAGPPPLGAHLAEIKDYLRGDNPRIASAEAMVKTTPPGRGSRLLRLAGDDPVHRRFALELGGPRLMVTGPFAAEDLGVACYHSKVGAVELYLNHLVDGAGEYVVVDMTAGAECFASGLFTKFDLTFLVAEPTARGIGVYRQYVDYAAGYDVPIAVVGNKVHDTADIAYLTEHVGADLLACFWHSPAVRGMDQGRLAGLDALEEPNHAVLVRMRAALDARDKDWVKFTRQAVEFHVKNSRGWANAALGTDLTAQIDPDFTLGPQALLTVPA